MLILQKSSGQYSKGRPTSSPGPGPLHLSDHVAFLSVHGFLALARTDALLRFRRGLLRKWNRRLDLGKTQQLYRDAAKLGNELAKKLQQLQVYR